MDNKPIEAHNYRALLLDGMFFTWGIAFMDTSSVLPVYLSTLTSSSVLIGLAAAIRNAGWFLPQIFVASYAAKLRHKMPLSIVAIIVSRISFLAIAASAFLLAGRLPALAVAVFFFLLTAFSLGDGIGGVPYVDICGKAISNERRGRLFGYSQALGGTLAFASGFLIRAILAGPRPAYPANFGLIFLIGAVLVLASGITFATIKEPPNETTADHGTLLDFLRLLPSYWEQSAAFRRLIFLRLATNSLSFTLPFYAVYARERLALPSGAVGIFVSAQMAGAMIGSLLLGRIGDRYGTRAVVRIGSITACLCPLIALLATPVAGLGYAGLATVLMFLPFVGIGVYGSAWMGYVNYLIEIVPAESRPIYAGLMNTIMAVTSVLAIVGGVSIQYLGYAATFALNLATTSIGVALSITMAEPRHAASAE